MKYAKEAARILDAEDFGEDDALIINKDPENQNMTKNAFVGVMSASSGSIKTRLSKNPQQTYLGFIFVSCRGMEKDG